MLHHRQHHPSKVFIEHPYPLLQLFQVGITQCVMLMHACVCYSSGTREDLNLVECDVVCEDFKTLRGLFRVNSSLCEMVLVGIRGSSVSGLVGVEGLLEKEAP